MPWTPYCLIKSSHNHHMFCHMCIINTSNKHTNKTKINKYICTKWWFNYTVDGKNLFVNAIQQQKYFASKYWKNILERWFKTMYKEINQPIRIR